MEKQALAFQNICKFYPGVHALSDVSFKAYPGEVLGLMGENGAGKSTLLKILGGDELPTKGNIVLDGQEHVFESPKTSLDSGISIIHQERQIVPELNVAENIFVGQLPKKAGFLNRKEMLQKTQKLIDEFGMNFKPYSKVGDLSLAMQQMVELMKDYSRGRIRVMAFDEPTASLSDREIEVLFKIMHKLKQDGVIILYVSHRMKEIFQITDRVVVLKDGKYSGESLTKETDEDKLIRMMVGRSAADIYPNRHRKKGKAVLEARNISTNFINDVSFSLHEGEVVGFSGLVGAGRSETARAIFGADKILKGELIVEGKKVNYTHPQDAIKDGIAFCPEDRKNDGLVLNQSVNNNITSAILKNVSKLGFLQNKSERKISESFTRSLRIKTPSLNQKVQYLSGGNQQKVVLAKWLSTNPKVLILDEPTRGIDVGAKVELYEIIKNLTEQNIAIMLISSELPEIIGLSDWIIVMSQGEITGRLDAKEVTEEKIMAYTIHKE